MNWEQVRLELRTALFADFTDYKHLDLFLDRLGESEPGRHLAACMLIDLNAGTVVPKLFARILSDCNTGAPDTVKEFGLALNRASQGDASFWVGRLQDDDGHSPRDYARVLEMGSFIRYCLTPGKFTDMSATSLRRVRLTYFSGEQGRPLGRVTRTFDGGRGRVWVLPPEDLHKIRKENKDDSGTAIRNALGLPIQHGVGAGGLPEFVAVLYPPSAVLVSAQPTTLDATWTSSPCYFLPAVPRSGWGLTYNCLGEGPTCRERVHSSLPRLDDGFRGIYLGIAATLDVTRWSSILAEAWRRLLALAAPK